MHEKYVDPGKGKNKYNERIEFWKGVIKDQLESGLNSSEFCAQHGLKKRQLNDWKYKLRKLNIIEKAKGEKKSNSGTFIPVLVSGRGEEICTDKVMLNIELKNGNACKLEFDFKEGVFLKILEVLNRC